MSDASTIVQEAADEDANIIFGAVVDPTLVGRIKITVIATGFDNTRHAASAADTPVDLTPYKEQLRLRADTPVMPERPGPPRISIARRPIIETPLVGGGETPPGELNADPGVGGDVDGENSAPATFDLPAFLRRQEG